MDRWGLTLPLPGLTLADHEELVRRAESAGYTDLWTGETAGPDGFTPLALSAAWTERARLGTGIVGVFQRGPALLAQQAAALADASEGRFVLGIGSSSDRIVEGWNRIPFERPLSKVRETLDFLGPALAGERTETGFKLEQKPQHRVPIVLAALRGKMLELAVERADGAFTNFLPLAGLPKVTAQLQGAPEGFELLCRFFCIPGEREQVEPLARFMFSSYITVPVYADFYRWLGYGEQITPMVEAWKQGDRRGRGGGGALGADRGDVHLRDARADEGAPRGLRRGRHNPPDHHPDRDAGQAGGGDRRFGALVRGGFGGEGVGGGSPGRSSAGRRSVAGARSWPARLMLSARGTPTDTLLRASSGGPRFTESAKTVPQEPFSRTRDLGGGWPNPRTYSV